MRRQPLSSRSSDKLRRLLEKPLLFRSPEGRAFSRIRVVREPRVNGRWCEVTLKEETPGADAVGLESLLGSFVWGRRGGAASALVMRRARTMAVETCEDENCML
jgi:hypothetical protein